jgi:hypothetical protein
MAIPGEVVRLAAIGDIHCNKGSGGTFRPLLAQAAEVADVLVVCGDLTDHGLPEEAQVLAREIAAAPKVPIVAVLGNHDYESGRTDEIRRILNDVGVTMLDGEACEIRGVGFAGIKGFAGGFGRGTLGYWGEPAIKQFVQEALDEALKLEAALMRLRSPQKDRRPALFADPRHGRGGAAGDFPLPGLQPAGGAARPPPGDGRRPRPRPPRQPRGADRRRHPGLQRVAVSDAAGTSPTGPLPRAGGPPRAGDRRAGRRRRHASCNDPLAQFSPPGTPGGGRDDRQDLPPRGQAPRAVPGGHEPDAAVGQNYGLVGPHPEKEDGHPTAHDIKEIHRQLQEYTDDELRQIPVLPRGSRLEQGKTYIDLKDPARAASSRPPAPWRPAPTTGSSPRARSTTCSGTA